MAAACVNAAICIVCWAAMALLITHAGWLFGITLLSAAAIGSAFVSLILTYYVMNRVGAKRRVMGLSFGLIFGSVAISVLLAGVVHDFSADGQTYHQQAIIALLEKWNPTLAPHYSGPYSIWISHYAKAPWILSASLVDMTGNIEAGKALAGMFAFSAGFLTYAALIRIAAIRPRLAVMAAILIALNPVVAYQIQTYYVDGLVASIVTIAALLGLQLATNSNSAARLGLICSLIVGINLKFTAGPFIFVVLALLFVWSLRVKRVAEARTLARAFFAGTMLAAIVGFNPYVTNFMDHGHPFYPLAGHGKVDILSDHVGSEFLGHNRFYKGGLSLIAESDSSMHTNVAPGTEMFRAKWPGVVTAGELKTFFSSTDARAGGFGPWASLIFIMATVYLIAIHVRPQHVLGSEHFAPFVMVIGLLLSGFLMPEFWWARYAPQLWTALLLAVAFSLGLARGAWRRQLGYAVLAACALNLMMMLVPASINRIVGEMDYRAQVALLRSISGKQPILMSISDDSIRYRLRVEGIRFTERTSEQCNYADNLRGSSTTICVPEAYRSVYKRGSPMVARILGREN